MSQNENTQKTDNNTNTQNGTSGTYKRIKIENLPMDITRDHIEELCSKYGRVNEIEMRRFGNGMRSYVTFFNVVDAEYALYRIFDMNYMGEKLKVYPAELTEKEISKRQEDAKERDRKRMEGRDKKKKNYETT
jgi:RNA recognition motif-containing protein